MRRQGEKKGRSQDASPLPCDVVSLRAFLDLYYLVSHQPVCLPVYGLRGLRARCLEQAENLALVLIEPVPKGLRFMVVLGF